MNSRKQPYPADHPKTQVGPFRAKLGAVHVVSIILLLFACVNPASAQERSAFVAGDAAAEIQFTRSSTRGWFFGVNSLDPILITHLGVYDIGGDGLASSHEVGVWANSTTGSTLLASTTIPAGTTADLIGSYRYVAIPPVWVGRGQATTLGATYAAFDPDDSRRPINGTFAAELSSGQEGRVSDGPELSRPWIGISRGREGEPNYSFYQVNFLFSVVPEPGILSLLGIGGCGLALCRRRRSGRS